MKRKIIQIAFSTDSSYERDSDYQNISSTMYALCHDGTIWFKDYRNSAWFECTPEIPDKECPTSAENIESEEETPCEEAKEKLALNITFK